MPQTNIVGKMADRAVAAGGTVIHTTTAARTGLANCYCVEVIEAATFSVFTAADCTVPTSVSLPAGTRIYSDAGITAYTMSTAGKTAEYYSE